ncbi:hypothetical protein QEN19_003399 [Hanseniaspora menglaensis]
MSFLRSLYVQGSSVVKLHTAAALTTFAMAAVVGNYLHFYKITKNSHYAYPDEWFASVSATIGDHFPERNIFHIMIVICSFPRFLLHIMQFSQKNTALAIIGFIRTIFCGTFVYITSSDNHDVHDVGMIGYIALTIPYYILNYKNNDNKNYTKLVFHCLFFITLIPLIYWFIQHSVHIQPGAYSVYAYFEWSLILQDVLNDHWYHSSYKNVFINLGGAQEDSLKVKPEEISESELLYRPELETVVVVEEKETIKIKGFSKDNNNLKAFLPESFVISLSMIVQSFLFFTNLTGLLCIIWYFPLWWMGISGYEAIIIVVIFPIIMCVPWIRKNVVSKYTPTLGILLMLGSKYVELPEHRLIVVGIACLFNSLGLLNQVLMSYNHYQFVLFLLLGLSLSVSLKMYYFGNNPLWPIMNFKNGGWNLRALIAGMIYSLFMTSLPPMEERKVLYKKNSKCSVRSIQKLINIISVGALFFSTHQLLTDSTTLIYWAWEGYNEDKTPLLYYPWNNLSAAVLLLSILATPLIFQMLNKLKINIKFAVVMLLFASTYVLANPDITEWNKYFYGALIYYLSIVLSYPFVLSSLFDSSSSIMSTVLVYSFGFFVYILFTLADIWTVAYAFVPYGHILRERLPTVVTILTGCIITGVLNSTMNNSKICDSVRFGEKINKKAVLLAVGLNGYFIFKAYTENDPFKDNLPKSYHADDDIITAGVWTVHFGLDNDMWGSEDKMATIIRDMELDVVGLLETDTQRPLMGNRDLVQTLAHKLNMYYDYGPGPNKHTWGCILLSKYPIVKSTHHLLPSPVGELAPAIYATLQLDDDKFIDVFVFHSGQEEDVEDRYLQSKYMQNLMGSTPENRGTILLSYLVTEPHVDNYNNYVSLESGMKDIEPKDSDRWCEYILFKNLQKIGYSRLARGDITDTELQIGRFKYMSEDVVLDMGDSQYNYNLLDAPLEHHWRFNDRFLGEGEDGHFYHVLERPHYYEWR